jgi:flagellar basal body rod protein FlgB
VDLESEMSALAQTQLQYAAVGRLMTGRLAMLRDAITGGR